MYERGGSRELRVLLKEERVYRREWYGQQLLRAMHKVWTYRRRMTTFQQKCQHQQEQTLPETQLYSACVLFVGPQLVKWPIREWAISAK